MPLRSGTIASHHRLPRDIDPVAVVVTVLFLEGDLVLFRLVDSHRLIARALPFEERIKPALHGPIVILKPAMYRQEKVSLRAVAMPLKDPDLCRGYNRFPGTQSPNVT